MAPLLNARFQLLFSSLRPTTSSSTTNISNISPHRVRTLVARITPLNPGDGVTPPESIPNLFVFIIFGLIGAGCVCSALWFFFIAENGGFYFKETDWEDYKSSVLSRLGPNGTIFSGTTRSTQLGLDSIDEEKSIAWKRQKKRSKKYSDYDEMSSQTASSIGKTELSSRMTDVSDLSHSTHQEKKKRKKNKRRRSPGSDMGTINEEMSEGVPDDLIAYRHEKPARVGGLNKESDASAFDGSTNCDSTNASEVHSHHTKSKHSTKAHKERRDLRVGGIRKVFSTSEGTIPSRRESSYKSPRSQKSYIPNVDNDHIKSEAKRLQAKGRAAQRRDFSFQPGDDSTIISASEKAFHREENGRRRSSCSPSKKIPGSFVEDSVLGSDLNTDIGTKSYHHPMPELTNLSTTSSNYTEERRRKRNAGGQRHGRDG